MGNLLIYFLLFLSALKSKSEEILEIKKNNNTKNCSEYQIRNRPLSEVLTIDYVVYNETNEEGLEVSYFKAQLILSGVKGWIGFGFAPQPRGMIGDVVIGLPGAGESNNAGLGTVKKYQMTGFFTPAQSERQTLRDIHLEQNDTMTLLRFTKQLKEEGEQSILANDEGASNTALWAYSTSNDFSYHDGRDSVTLDLKVCDPLAIDGEEDDVVFEVPKKAKLPPDYLWTVHGLLATLAWGILSPLAIGSAMLRRYFTKEGLWYKLHFYLNLSTLVLTIISFGIAVAMYEMSMPSGEDPKHFVKVAHATVGLVIMIFVSIQVLNGLFRPHATEKGEAKALSRSVWEYSHRIIGVALIAICWYQINDGMYLYQIRYTADYRTTFWSITGTLSSIIIVIYIWSKVADKKKERKRSSSSSNNNTPYIAGSNERQDHEHILVNEEENSAPISEEGDKEENSETFADDVECDDYKNSSSSNSNIEKGTKQRYSGVEVPMANGEFIPKVAPPATSDEGQITAINNSDNFVKSNK